jgi:hypothetical protein
VELLEGGAGSLEVGELHPGIFAGEDDVLSSSIAGAGQAADSPGKILCRTLCPFLGQSLCLPSFFLMSGANSPMVLTMTPTQACVMTL